MLSFPKVLDGSHVKDAAFISDMEGRCKHKNKLVRAKANKIHFAYYILFTVVGTVAAW